MKSGLLKTCKLHTKQEVRSDVESLKERFIKKLSSDGTKTMSYYNTLIGIIDKFIDTLDKSILMEHLEDYWGYDYGITYEGMELCLVHYSDIVEVPTNSFRYYYFEDQTYRLFRVDSKLLTVEEYADRYKVETGTVRQWIRRGKIRTAIKYGNEWRIPELTDLPKRGWSDAAYIFEKEMVLEEKYEYLRNYDTLRIIQDEHNRKIYQIVLTSKENKTANRVYNIDVKEKEQLELYCISNPNIHYCEAISENWMQDMLSDGGIYYS